VSRRKIPELRHHKGVEKGYARFDGVQKYFGRSGSWPRDVKNPPGEVQAAYDRYLAEWLQGKVFASQLPKASRLTVLELATAYLTHAQTYYRKRGKQTSEVGAIQAAQSGRSSSCTAACPLRPSTWWRSRRSGTK
jgi:hypothetical protein